ncbi:MAG TPA: hypothetical protein P5318_05975 [Candidatus Hydrogenedentes bacterium]|nr:hypothetical protein [Candidatus Hydrogenedentota bacterium]HRT19658.1 hypothetical protein [Candidatus Hydrogenedentota bacterium]HRT64432.1 hypothetical protein [Candidatus Hydrogenedentota bacterium]
MRAMPFFWSVCLAAFCVHASDSWKLPLEEKERILEKNNVERHNILGLYPSQVEVPLDGGPVDQSTRGNSNIAHAVCWTANYLGGASYRYAFLKKSGAPAEDVAKAKARADELFESIYRCQLVTGVRGLQARGYAIGHGESYEERGIERLNDSWQQGAGEYAHLRWRGSPSHHNYSASARGLGNYYDLAAEGAQKARCREAIDALVGYWVNNDFKIWHIDRVHNTPILGFHDGKTLNTRILMAIGGAKIAHHATGDPKYQAVYERLIEKFHVRGLTSFRTEKDHDDAEHCLCHLENLFRIETDPELLAAYRVVLEGIWSNHKDDAQSLFTYIYYSLAPDAPGRDKALKEALYTLQTYPTETIFEPTMNSLRPDLKPPYPMYAAVWDNEYIWKGHLLNKDGWLSRIVMGVAVPAEDPVVLYAFDTNGDLYQSRDGAATAAGWHPVDAGIGSPVRALAAGPRIRWIYVACDDGFRVSTTGGYSWRRLDVPEEGGKAVGVQIEPGEQNTLYAVREKAVYRTVFTKEKDIGKTWEKAAKAPEIREGERRFKPDANGVLKSGDGGKTWQLKADGLRIPRAVTVFTPENTDWVFAGTPAGLYLSKDGGEHWENGHLVLQFIKNTRRDLGGAAFIDAYWRGRYHGFIDDATARAPMP